MGRFWLQISPQKVGGSKNNHWVLDAVLPNQQLTEGYDDYLEMMERVQELLLCFRKIES